MDYLVKEAIIKSLVMRNTNDTHIERLNSDPIRVNGIEFFAQCIHNCNKKEGLQSYPLQ